ncbi:MAG: PAS domain-containing protein [bacterium]
MRGSVGARARPPSGLLKIRPLRAEYSYMGQSMRGSDFHPEYEALRREYNDFRYHLPDALLEIDLSSFQVLYLNRMAEIVFGFSASDVEDGLNGSALVGASEFPRMLQVLQGFVAESRANGTPYSRSGRQDVMEFRLKRRDGSEFVAQTQSSFVLDANGVPVRMLSLIREVTGRPGEGQAGR